MQYTVVPFVANIGKGQGAQAAAEQLANLINQYASQGWRYARMENVEINIHDPGTKGCFGFGPGFDSCTHMIRVSPESAPCDFA